MSRANDIASPGWKSLRVSRAIYISEILRYISKLVCEWLVHGTLTGHRQACHLELTFRAGYSFPPRSGQISLFIHASFLSRTERIDRISTTRRIILSPTKSGDIKPPRLSTSAVCYTRMCHICKPSLTCSVQISKFRISGLTDTIRVLAPYTLLDRLTRPRDLTLKRIYVCNLYLNGILKNEGNSFKSSESFSEQKPSFNCICFWKEIEKKVAKKVIANTRFNLLCRNNRTHLSFII